MDFLTVIANLATIFAVYFAVRVYVQWKSDHLDQLQVETLKQMMRDIFILYRSIALYHRDIVAGTQDNNNRLNNCFDKHSELEITLTHYLALTNENFGENIADEYTSHDPSIEDIRNFLKMCRALISLYDGGQVKFDKIFATFPSGFSDDFNKFQEYCQPRTIERNREIPIGVINLQLSLCRDKAIKSVKRKINTWKGFIPFMLQKSVTPSN